MAYKPKIIKVNESTYLALREYCAEVMESASKGRRGLPDLRLDGISIDYAIRLLLREHNQLKARRTKADKKRVSTGKRRKVGQADKPTDVRPVSEG